MEIREFGAYPISVQSVSVSVSSVQFSYAMNPGGPEGAKRRLWAAQGGLRAVRTGAKDLDLTAAPWLPGLTPPSCSGQAFPGAGNVAPTPFQFSQSVSVSVSVQFSSVMQ